MRRWLVALVVLLSACGGPQSETAAPDASTAPSDVAVSEPSAGTPSAAAGATPAALNWTAPLVGGGQLDGNDLAGGDVVLWFWAPW